MNGDTLERRIQRNSPRVALLLFGTAAGAEVASRLLSVLTDLVAARIAGALFEGVRTWCLVMALVVVVFWGTAAVTVAANRCFPNRSRKMSILLLSAVVVTIVLACVFFVPLCLGSLKEGTYDCVSIAQRVGRMLPPD